MWNSRADDEHFKEIRWQERTSLKKGDPNVTADPLIDPRKIILPPLHNKLGLMKQFVKAIAPKNIQKTGSHQQQGNQQQKDKPLKDQLKSSQQQKNQFKLEKVSCI